VTRLLSISVDTTLFPWVKRTPADGIRATIAVAIALIVGQLAGHPGAGAIAASSAFTVGFAIFHEALASALLSMGIVTIGIASATLTASYCAEWTPLVLLLAILAATNYALLAALSPTAGWIGQQCAVFVVVASFFPDGLHYALGRTSMVLVGGASQMLVFTVFYLSYERARVPVDAPFSTRLRDRLWQLFTQFRQELQPSHSVTFYAVRLSVTLVLCTAIYRHFHVPNGYWSPMTGLLVLKPDWSNTLSRSVARLTGTLIGVGIGIVIALYIPLTTPIILLLVVVFAWASFSLQAVNYAAFSLCVTLYIVCLFHFGGFSETAAAHVRLFNTALGGTIALLVDAAGKLIGRQNQSRRR